jgi:hypothetical protein
MKPIFFTTVFLVLASASAAYAAAPDAVAKAVKTCCDLAAECCDKPCCNE